MLARIQQQQQQQQASANASRSSSGVPRSPSIPSSRGSTPSPSVMGARLASPSNKSVSLNITFTNTVNVELSVDEEGKPIMSPDLNELLQSIGVPADQVMRAAAAAAYSDAGTQTTPDALEGPPADAGDAAQMLPPAAAAAAAPPSASFAGRPPPGRKFLQQLKRRQSSKGSAPRPQSQDQASGPDGDEPPGDEAAGGRLSVSSASSSLAGAAPPMPSSSSSPSMRGVGAYGSAQMPEEVRVSVTAASAASAVAAVAAAAAAAGRRPSAPSWSRSGLRSVPVIHEITANFPHGDAEIAQLREQRDGQRDARQMHAQARQRVTRRHNISGSEERRIVQPAPFPRSAEEAEEEEEEEEGKEESEPPSRGPPAPVAMPPRLPVPVATAAAPAIAAAVVSAAAAAAPSAAAHQDGGAEPQRPRPVPPIKMRAQPQGGSPRSDENATDRSVDMKLAKQLGSSSSSAFQAHSNRESARTGTGGSDGRQNSGGGPSPRSDTLSPSGPH
jgi:hypothetical protein